MAGVVQVKLRSIGSSVGVLLPKEHLDELNLGVGDEIEIALLKHKDPKEIEKGFGMARHFKKEFQRDKKTREFN